MEANAIVVATEIVARSNGVLTMAVVAHVIGGHYRVYSADVSEENFYPTLSLLEQSRIDMHTLIPMIRSPFERVGVSDLEFLPGAVKLARKVVLMGKMPMSYTKLSFSVVLGDLVLEPSPSVEEPSDEDVPYSPDFDRGDSDFGKMFAFQLRQQHVLSSWKDTRTIVSVYHSLRGVAFEPRTAVTGRQRSGARIVAEIVYSGGTRTDIKIAGPADIIGRHRVEWIVEDPKFGSFPIGVSDPKEK